MTTNKDYLEFLESEYKEYVDAETFLMGILRKLPAFNGKYLLVFLKFFREKREYYEPRIAWYSKKKPSSKYVGDYIADEYEDLPF